MKGEGKGKVMSGRGKEGKGQWQDKEEKGDQAEDSKGGRRSWGTE